MPQVHITKPFLLQLDIGTTKKFAPGVQEITDEEASHWYVQAHVKDTQVPGPVIGTKEYADAMRAKAAAAKEQADALAKEAALAEAAHREEEKAAEVAAANVRQAEAAKVALEETKKSSREKLKVGK